MDASIVVVGVVSGLVATWMLRGRSKKLAPLIESTLRAHGALTLPALTEAAGLKGFSARGKVALAVNALASEGKVRTIPAPDGTPQLQKVNFIKYELTVATQK